MFSSDTVEGDTRVPHNASVMSSTRRTDTPARYISISASSNRALAPPIALDNSRLKRLLAQLWYPHPYLASLGLQAALVVASAGIATRLAALIHSRSASASS